MRPDQICNLHHGQHGSTLIVSLIILIMLMLLGVTAINTSNMQYTLAGNLQFAENAMNNTETSLTASETFLSTSGVNGFNALVAAASPEVYIATSAVTPLTMDWTDANSKQVGADNQRYIVQQVSTDSRLAGSSQAIGGRTSTGCNQVNTYEITARGQSARGATRFVQSYYSVLSCP